MISFIASFVFGIFSKLIGKLFPSKVEKLKKAYKKETTKRRTTEYHLERMKLEEAIKKARSRTKVKREAMNEDEKWAELRRDLANRPKKLRSGK